MNWFAKVLEDKGWNPLVIIVGILFLVLAVAYFVTEGKFPEPIVYEHPAVVRATELDGPPPPESIAEAQNKFKAARSAQLGQLGDMLGGIFNPVLAFITAIGLLITILISGAQLRQTQKAMHDAEVAAAEQRRLDRLATRVAATTALLDDATKQLELLRRSEYANQLQINRAMARQGELLELLAIAHDSLWRQDAGDAPLPPHLQREYERREREWAQGGIVEEDEERGG